MILVKQKIFYQNGEPFVSLRSYEVSKAHRLNEPIYVRVENEWMKLERWQLDMDREQFTKEVFKSQFKKGEDYCLYDYLWKPTEEAKTAGVKELEDYEAKQLSRQVL